MSYEMLAIVFGALIVGYIMGRISAKPVVIDPFRAAPGKAQDPGDIYEGPDEWDESMNRSDK